MSPTSYRTAPPRDEASVVYDFRGRESRSPKQIVMAIDLRALPKVQLHCHLEGTLEPFRFRELAAKHGVDIGARALVPLDEVYRFASFREFLLLFRDVSEVLRTPEDFAALAADYARDAAAQGVRYAEVFVSPSVWTWFHHDVDVPAIFAAFRGAFDDARRTSGLEVALICDLTRNFGAERALATARLALDMKPYGVIGVGLGGDEATYPPELFIDAYAFAQANGLRRVVHAGEAAGPASVRGAIDALGAERIGHGVRSIEDPTLVSELAERRIPLEICPTSNRLTGAVPADAPHPIAALDAAGVVIVLDADDPALFGTTLLDEYALVARELGDQAVVRFAANAIEASFAPDITKARLRAELAASRTLVASVEH
jgi:adenosine deaminase